MKESAVLPKPRRREVNSERQTETGTLSPSSQAHAGGFSGRTTRPGRPWGSTETVPLCTDAAGGDSCCSPLHGKQAGKLSVKTHCSEKPEIQIEIEITSCVLRKIGG